jgi:hypothetical protein
MPDTVSDLKVGDRGIGGCVKAGGRLPVAVSARRRHRHRTRKGM